MVREVNPPRRESIAIGADREKRELSFEQFCPWYERDALELYEMIGTDFDRATRQIEYLEEEDRIICHGTVAGGAGAGDEQDTQDQDTGNTIASKDAAVQKLVDEATEMKEMIVQQAMRIQGNRETTPSVQESYSRRSAKVADPPTFTGKSGDDETSFEMWELRVRDKLNANADYYENAGQRLAAVKG
ncbi:hypothetical protein PHISCL_09733 [Aspergillus sclerotialis]|uniref:Uncharacterized protein n=1 Tax=Aspergillus sclerotialis TaxID=2070753 RepID=A0A3A2ZL95_9EURO|nr:hypothetical protein PHISCL_09733 [Aspergillus sclerotialis]